ncbi:MAG: tetratricopeptide repeat protein, partial [Caulobacteraceae bacterium]
GKVYWLDGTRTGDRDLGSIRVPPFLWALPIQTAGAALTPLAAAPLAEPDALTVLKLDASAGLSLPAPAHAEIRLRGDVATDLNLKVADLSPANLDRVLRGYWTKQYDFIEVKSVKATFDKANGEETWVMDGVASMAWDTTAGATGKRYEANNAGLGWKADFKRDLGPHIDAPFAVDFPFYEKSVETIILPNGGAGFVIDGDPIDKLVAGRAFLRGARIDKGVFSMQASTRALIREFPAGEALAAEAALRGMANEGLFVRAPANYADTDQEIDKLIASQPKTASEFTDRGWALLQRDAIEKAVADFDKAIALDGAASLAYADRAGARFQLGQFDGAKADAAKATALDPRQAVAWRVFGLLAAREGRFADAAAMYTRAIGEDSSNAWTYGQRASAYWDLSDSRGALADLARELDLDPASADAANDRATIFNIIGRPDLAKAEMDRLVAARPDDQAARVMRSLQFARMGRGADARRDIEAVIAVKPTADEYLIAANERDKDDLAGRWADVDAALKLDPKAPDALVLRAGIEDRSGKPALAIQELSDALTVQPKPLELRIARARAYGRAGDMKLAGADFSEVRAAATGDADRMNALCWAEAAFPPLLDAALRDCDASVRLAPLHAAAIDSRALVLLRLGRLDEALAAYDKALMLRPHQGASLYGRGIVKLRKGLVKEGHADLDAARRNYARAGDELNDMGVRT